MLLSPPACVKVYGGFSAGGELSVDAGFSGGVGFSAAGSSPSAFFGRARLRLLLTALAFASTSIALARSALSSANRLDATPARDALSATWPSFVIGAYAPPANLNPQRPHAHIPTDIRFTAETWHEGHSCGVLIVEITDE